MISPKIIFERQFITHEEITAQYSHYGYKSDVTPQAAEQRATRPTRTSSASRPPCGGEAALRVSRVAHARPVLTDREVHFVNSPRCSRGRCLRRGVFGFLCARPACFSSTSASDDAGSPQNSSETLVLELDADGAVGPDGPRARTQPPPDSTRGGGSLGSGRHERRAHAGSQRLFGPSSNSLGIQGAWYAYGDDWGTNGAPPGDCEIKGMHAASACSSITFPPPAMASDAGGRRITVPRSRRSTPGTMCLSGTAAKVVGSDYSNMFGIGIGLDFNNQAGVKMPYDASTNHVVGFSFHIAGIPAGASVRVELPIPATDAAGDSWSITAVANGDYTADLTTLGERRARSEAVVHARRARSRPFDATMVESIQFHVPTNTTAAVTIPASTPLCVSNFKAIVGP